MSKISFLEFIIRGIPEGLIFFLAMYAFTKNKINTKKYLTSSILYSVMVYLMKFLPIQKGVDYILNLILLMVLTIIINKIDIVKTLKASIIIMLVEFMCEGINVYFVQFVMKKDLNELFKNPMTKIVYSYPSLLIFGCIAVFCFIRMLKRKELKVVSHGKINK